MLRLIIFMTFILTLIPRTSAADGGFAQFCQDQFNEKAAGQDDNTTCTATFDLDGVTKDTAFGICQYRSRFAVQSAVITAPGKLECTWHLTGKCNNDDGHYINGYCYKVYAKCPAGDSKITPLRDRQAFRWIALTFAEYFLLQFQLPPNHPKPDRKFVNGTLQALLGDNEDHKELAVLLTRMPAFGGKPGDIVYGQRLRSICRKEAFGESQTDAILPSNLPSAPAKETHHGSGAIGGHIIDSKDGKYRLIFSRNVYSLKLNKQGQVDLNSVHDICENMCKKCFAATPGYLDASKLKSNVGKGRYWLPGARPPISAETTNCENRPRDKGDDVNSWQLLFHKKHGQKSAIMEAKYWKEGLPNRACSDQGRYAAAYQEGKVIDVPVFDRLPVICARGEPPTIPESVSNCLKNSESDGKKGCKCKAGYKDVKDPKSWENQKDDNATQQFAMDLPESLGYICVKDTCQHQQELRRSFEAIFFVIDGSGSIVFSGYHNWENIQKFLFDAKTWLPRDVYVYFRQYGGTADSGSGWVLPGWSDDEYDYAVVDAVGGHKGGHTVTYEAIYDVTGNWRNYPAQPRKAIMVVITDGQGYHNDKRYIIQRALDSGIILKYVGVGSDIRQDWMEEDVGKENVIIMEHGYGQLESELKSKLVDSINCERITKADVLEAHKRPYE